ncbi:MAG: Glycolate dehydrogenase, FAD-binding subunit GlcE [Afipia sp.]|jgi:glycolate oxidase FAD binding subunit|nr:MAG: Glycolate dehydrogenase, FAD-binding subunit GlcE [Afipia sp.]
MFGVLKPRDEKSLSESIKMAAMAGMPLIVSGTGSKSGIGRPNEDATTLTTQRMQGVSIYEPTELVMGALPGTLLSAINETLAAQGQMLPFEPMDYQPLLGGGRGPTIGGIVAGNISGPRRIMAGACRDSLIGVRLVNGRGDIVKSGGRVMKNVTGLDLVKLNCGAWGTLGVFSEVIFKVLPKPECASSLVLRGLSDATAIAALTTALGSPFSVSAAAHLPKEVVPEPLTVVRIEGFAPSVAYGCGQIAKLWRPYGKADLLEGQASADTWTDVRDARWLADPAESAIWRLSLAPSKAPGIVTCIKRALDVRHFYDWGGGLVWLAVNASEDAGSMVIRDAMRGSRGHATLLRASRTVRSKVEIFEPLPPSLAELTRRIKLAFDPDRILNFGRMYSGV